MLMKNNSKKKYQNLMLMKLNYHNSLIKTVISGPDKHASKKQNVTANNSNFMSKEINSGWKEQMKQKLFISN